MDLTNVPHVVGCDFEASELSDRTLKRTLVVYTDLELDCFAPNFDSSELDDLFDRMYAFLKENEMSFDSVTVRMRH